MFARFRQGRVERNVFLHPRRPWRRPRIPLLAAVILLFAVQLGALLVMHVRFGTEIWSSDSMAAIGP